MTTANYLTLLRLLISPLFLVIYLEHDWLGISAAALPWVLLVLLSVSELSDAFDGWLARRYNEVTDFGKIVDPMADSISRLAIFLAFTEQPVNLPMGLIFVFLYRDSVISTLRTLCALKGFALAARKSGKIKSVIQGVAAFAVLFLMVFQSMGYLSLIRLQEISAIIVLLAALYAVYSGIDYIYANRNYVARTLLPSPK